MGLRLSDEAVSVLIEALEAQLREVNKNWDISTDEKLDCLKFIATNRGMMHGFIEFIGGKYAGKPDKIRSALDYLHDNYMDISIIPGFETIFKSWDT